jgi:hypothetical protein
MSLKSRMRRVRFALAATALGAIAGSLAAAPAQAAPTWLAPQPLFSTPVNSLLVNGFFSAHVGIDVASDAAGNSVAVWMENHNKTGGGTECQAKWSARAPGGTWSAPADLSTPMAFCLANGTPVRVAMNASGTAVAAWQYNIQGGPRQFVIQTATRPPGGAFGAVQTLSPSTGTSFYAVSPDVAINDNGVTAVGWEGDPTNIGSFQFYARVRQPGADFAPLETVTEAPHTADTYFPHIAIDASGNVVAGWAEDFSDGAGCHVLVETAFRPAGGTFPATPADLTTGSDMPVNPPSCFNPSQYSPVFAFDGAGRATALWSYWNGTKIFEESSARDSSASGSAFGPVGGVNSSDTGNASAPSLAVDRGSNTAVAVWVQCDVNCVVRSADRPSGQSFGDLRTLSGPGGAGTFGPAVGFDPLGDATTVWGGPAGGSTDQVQATMRPPGANQVFGGVQTISGAAATGVSDNSPAIAFDNQGNAVAIWQHKTSASPGTTIQYAGFDNAAPTISGLSVASGVAGQQIAMSASASDRWTGATLTWNFGDGTSAAGPSVTHAYANHGSYGVTVVATDGVGNSSSAGTTVTIGCAPPPPNVKIDANCVKIPTPRVTFVPRFRGFSGTHGALRFTSLIVTKLTSGAKLVMVCKGGKKKGCPFSKKTIKKTGTKANLAKFLKKRTLKAKAVIEFRGTKAGFIGLVIDFTVKGGTAVETFRCMPAGSTKIQKTCAS